MFRRIIGLAAAAVLVSVSGAAFADTLTLKTGQVFEGRVVEAQDKVTLFLPYGTVAFSKDEVADVKYGPTPQQVYRDQAAKLADNDAEGHYKLGMYCEEKKMLAEARAEYEKTIAADPNHAGARAKLGYVRQDDKWMKYEDYMAQKGYVLYKGRYVTSQEAEELEAREKDAARERDARNLVRTLAYLITYSTEEKSRESQDRLAGISDPLALDAVIEQLDNQNAAVRTAALTALMNYREDSAALAALDEAINDPVPDIRNQAASILNRKQNEAAYQAAVAALATDNDEARFRVSEILGGIGDVRAIPDLIEYLSWTRPSTAAAGGEDRFPMMRRPLAPSYVAGVRAKVAPGVVAYEPILGAIDHGRRVIIEPDNPENQKQVTPEWNGEFVLNYQALSALKTMTGQDFRFDKDAWRNWYVTNQWRFQKGPVRSTPPTGQ